MTTPKIATREEWLAARDQLLAREKERTRLGDELARQRQELPWLPVEKAYTLQTADGPKTLEELFDGRSQLVIYHFMFAPDYDAGCPVCSSIADSFNGVLAQLAARDVTMISVSRAPLDKLLAYRDRLGWSFNWASSYESDFNYDFEHTESREQAAIWAEQARTGRLSVRRRLRDRPGGLCGRAPGSERVRANRRRRLSHLRHHGAGAGAGDDLLRHPRPGRPGPRWARAGRSELDAPSRRVRDRLRR